MAKIIGIMSFKGGVGKSITTINLAAGFVKMGKRAIVVDGNFLSPNLHLYLGLLNPKKTLKEIISSGTDVRNAIYEHKSGVDLLPCNFYKNVDFDGFAKVIKKLKNLYDFIIIDSGPSYTDEVIAVLMVCDELVFVATPDYPTLAATVRISKFAKFKNVNIAGIVLNRVKGKGFEVGKKDVEKTVGEKVIGKIPEDLNVGRSVKKFDVVVGRRWSRAGKGFLKLAKRLK